MFTTLFWVATPLALLGLIVLCIVNRWLAGTWLFRFMVYLDIFACAVFTGNPDMTISARCGLYLRHDPPPLWKGLGWCLNHIQQGHCERAIVDDEIRARTALTMLADAKAATTRAGVRLALHGR